jgi:membrane-associated protease RseP (regulator of RpoE activity)
MDTSGLTLRFKIGSIPVAVEPWFWLSGLVLNPQDLQGPRIVLWLLIYFVSILVHEMGHALAAIAFGARASVTLHSFGGVTRPTLKFSRWRDIAMTLAGPGAGFVLGALSVAALYVVPNLPPLALWALQRLMFVNFLWGVMNLLPIPPLDGGHVLLGLMGRRHERTARIVGVVAAGLVALYGFSAGQPYLAIMFAYLAFQNVQTLRAMSSH